MGILDTIRAYVRAQRCRQDERLSPGFKQNAETIKALTDAEYMTASLSLKLSVFTLDLNLASIYDGLVCCLDRMIYETHTFRHSERSEESSKSFTSKSL